MALTRFDKVGMKIVILGQPSPGQLLNQFLRHPMEFHPLTCKDRMSAFPQASPKESSLKLVSLSSRAILHSWPVDTVLQRNTSNNKNGSHWRSHSSTFWVAEDLTARSVGFRRGCHGGRTTSYKISWDCSMLALCCNCVPRLYIVGSSNTSLLRRRYHAV